MKHVFPSDKNGCTELICYSTKKEQKSDDCLSKFDWVDLSHNAKVFQKPIKYHLLVIH